MFDSFFDWLGIKNKEIEIKLTAQSFFGPDEYIAELTFIERDRDSELIGIIYEKIKNKLWKK